MASADSHDFVAARELIVAGACYETSCVIVDSADEVAVPTTQTNRVRKGSDEQQASHRAV